MAARPSAHTCYLLVDGYNLIKADPLLRRHEQVSLAAARQALERALRAYCRTTGCEATVYYDGDRVSAPEPVFARGQVWAEFSRRPEKADDLIKRAVQQHHGARHVRVISSDREIRRFAARHHISATPSAEFIEELGCPPAGEEPAREPETPRELDPDLQLSRDEVAAWERLFDAAADED